MSILFRIIHLIILQTKQLYSASQLCLIVCTGGKGSVPRPVHVSMVISCTLEERGLVLLGTRVGSLAFPAVRVEAFLFLGQGLGLHGVYPPLLVPHLFPLVPKNNTNGSVVLARIHLGVLHSVFLGKEHEGIHWPLAFGGCGVVACP